MLVLCIQLRFLCMQDRHSTNWVSSLPSSFILKFLFKPTQSVQVAGEKCPKFWEQTRAWKGLFEVPSLQLKGGCVPLSGPSYSSCPGVLCGFQSTHGAGLGPMVPIILLSFFRTFMKLFSTRPSKQFPVWCSHCSEFLTYWQKPTGEPSMVALAPGPVVGTYSRVTSDLLKRR